MNSSKKTRVPGILIILILMLFIGLGWGYHNQIANKLFPQKATVASNKDPNAGNQDPNASLVHRYPSFNPITNLSDCQIIVRRNLFEPLGGRIAEPTLAKTINQVIVAKQEPPKPPPDPIYDLILTGIVYNGNELLALIEDSSKGRSFYLRKGDKLKDYYVEKITDREVVLMNGDSKITQALGSKTYYNINGKLLASRPANAPIAMNETSNRSEPSVAKSEPGSSASSNNGNANLSLIEQMKARRKKELEQE
ncbi:MAG: hypothetical protein AAB116_17275 [Candidatus Poribacteria bacterium]